MNSGVLPRRTVRVAVMLSLFTAAAIVEALYCSSLSSLTNSDTWWHLSSGLWILHNHALPHSGLFSQASGQPPRQIWIATSWLYDLKLAVWYKLLGLASIPMFLMFFKAALAVVTFLLAGGRRGNFWPAVALSAIAQYILGGVQPGPAYCSIFFFGVELLVLFEIRRSLCGAGAGVPSTPAFGVMGWLAPARATPAVFCLPPLFLLWANLHIQFVYGIALLLLFLAALACEQVIASRSVSQLAHDRKAEYRNAENAEAAERRKNAAHGVSRGSETENDSAPEGRKKGFAAAVVQPLAFGNVAMVAALSLAATLITPYFYRPYEVFFATAFSAANPYLLDFRAPNFRQPQDYLLLLLAMAAFLALGLRRSRDPFPIALLAGCAALSFYSQRDTWLVTLAAVAVIGEAIYPAAQLNSVTLSGEAIHPAAQLNSVTLSGESKGPYSRPNVAPTAGTPPSREILIAAVLTVVLLALAIALRIPRRPEALLAKAAQSYPVAACNYIREHRLPQPLFNAFEWGGFLTWYLPEYPVAIDGRTDLYGDDFVIEYSKVMNADAPYTEFPALAGARTILLPKSAIMAEALSSVPVFKVAYSDEVAVVLTRE